MKLPCSCCGRLMKPEALQGKETPERCELLCGPCMARRRAPKDIIEIQREAGERIAEEERRDPSKRPIMRWGADQ